MSKKKDFMKVKLSRNNDAFQFKATGASGISALLDAASETGGHDQGLRPMEMVLMGLGGCSAFDIVHILKKQRQDLVDLDIEIEGTRRSEIPKIFTEIHMRFVLRGDIDPVKAEKAVRLSVEKYCSVHDMLKFVVNITWSMHIESVEIS